MANPFFTPDAPGLLNDELGSLVIRPLEQESTALQQATTVIAHEHTFRVPVLAADSPAVWAAEGEDLSTDKPDVTEVSTSFFKTGGVVRVSQELQQDATPEAAQLVGLSLARRIARNIDKAFYGDLGAPAPAGLASLLDVQTVTLGTPSNLDGFNMAAALSQSAGGTITSWAINPGNLLQLADLKELTGSNRGLLQPDPTQPGRLLIGGQPLVVSPDCPLGTIYGIPREFVIIPIRQDVSVSLSEERYFETDELAVKATLRLGFLFPNEAAVIRLSITGGTVIGDNS